MKSFRPKNLSVLPKENKTIQIIFLALALVPLSLVAIFVFVLWLNESTLPNKPVNTLRDIPRGYEYRETDHIWYAALEDWDTEVAISSNNATTLKFTDIDRSTAGILNVSKANTPAVTASSSAQGGLGYRFWPMSMQDGKPATEQLSLKKCPNGAVVEVASDKCEMSEELIVLSTQEVPYIQFEYITDNSIRCRRTDDGSSSC